MSETPTPPDGFSEKYREFLEGDLAERLHPARDLPPARRPRRRFLCLSDFVPTSVYVHRREGAAARLPVLYVHGIQSHGGWYVGSSAAMADAGHPVYQVTRRGSGDSPAPRGHARSARQLLEDVAFAVGYVLHQTGADPYSSGPWFDGWRGLYFDVRGLACPVARPQSWLLRVGWRMHGEIGIDELPALR